MITHNLVIGTDKYGYKLQCGDICSFKVKLQRPNREEEVEELIGMIIYDPDSYAYAFETLDDFAPILCMYCAEYGSVQRLYEASVDNFNNIPNGDKWKEIYIKNLMVLK